MSRSPTSDHQHSRTQPTTPLRSRPSTQTSQSVPSSARSRLHFVRLPQDDLASILGQPSQIGIKKATETISSQSHKPNTRLRQSELSGQASRHSSRRSSGPHSRHDSVLSTPHSRRLSDHLTIRRRRRSSAGATYVSGYQGPITKDFLRTFSRALLHDQERTPPEYESDKVFQALDNEHRLHLLSPSEQTHYSEFDYSLPLPSDDAMRSPPSTADLESASSAGSPKKEAPKAEKKPAFKSYLERILDTRKRSSLFEHETPNDVDEHHHGMRDIISTSKFVIENTIQGLPDFAFGKETQSTDDLKLAEPLVVNENAIHTDSEESSDNGFKAPELTLPRRAHRPSFNLQKTPEYENSDVETVSKQGVESLGKSFEEEAALEREIDFQDDLLDAPSEPPSDLGIISGHFTIDNEDIDDQAQFHGPGEVLGENLESDEPVSRATVRRPRFPLSSEGSKRPRSMENMAIPKYLMKGMVSTVTHLPSLNENGESAAKRPKTQRLSPALLQVVLKSSNEFLQSVMKTLKAYAEHRSSDKISIEDAMLFLNRLKVPSSSPNEMRSVAKLAHDLFPLETLVSLDNSLQQATLKKLKKRQADIDIDDAYSLDASLYAEVQKQETDSGTDSTSKDYDADDDDFYADDD